MGRVVSFGCSYTYGHGLTDCHIPVNLPGYEYSRYAWPTLLGNMLGCETINLSKPSSSNIHLLWKILNFQFQHDDICVVMWTHFHRHPYSNLKNNSEIVAWDDYDTMRVQLVETEKENLIIRNYITINHAYTWLKQNKINCYFISGTRDIKDYKCPEILTVPNLFDTIHLPNMMCDLALDKRHPGHKTHENIAKKLFDNINTESQG